MTHQTKLLEMGSVTAYGIALQQGFVGTIQEWLDSLHARIGENGNWWVGDVDTGVLADPAQLRLLTELARNAASVAVTAADSAVTSNDEAKEAQRGAEAARERAESAAIHQPIPNAETETWWVWDAAVEAYVDSGLGYSATDAEVSQPKSDLTNKLPKSPAAWEPWTAEEQAAAQERIGILSVEEVLF